MSPLTAEVRPATDEDLARFYGGITFTSPWTGRAIRRGRLIAGFGGAVEVESGVWVAFLDVPAHMRKPSLYRHVRAGMTEIVERGGHTIRAAVDDSIPQALNFMVRLGFKPTDEQIDGRAVFEWRN